MATIIGTAGSETLVGSDGIDSIVGNGGSDSIAAGAGDDQISEVISAASFDLAHIDGGAGMDNLFVTGPALPSTMTFVVGADGHQQMGISPPTGGMTLDTFSVEGITLAADNLTSAGIVSTNGPQSVILLQSGANVFAEGGAAPFLTLTNFGAGAALSVMTGLGDDFIDATRMGFFGHTQTIFAGGGNDTVFVNNSIAHGEAGNDTFVWFRDDGSDTIDGGAGVDSFSASTGGSADTITLTTNAAGHVIESLNGVVQDLVGVETISIAAGDRSDTITLNQTVIGDARTVNVDLSGSAGGPDGAADTVNLFSLPLGGTLAMSAGADGNSLQASYSIFGAPFEAVNITALDALDTVNVAGTDDGDVFLVSPMKTPAHVTLDGKAGLDLDVVNGGPGADTISASANGAAADLTMNGSGVLSLVNVEELEFDAGPGSDLFQLDDLSGTAVRNVEVDFAFTAANAEADTLVVNGTLRPLSIQGDGNAPAASFDMTTAARVSGAPSTETVVRQMGAADKIVINLGDGADSVSFGSHAPLGQVIINAGGGADQISSGFFAVVNGGDGDDRITTLSGGLVDAGAGNDFITDFAPAFAGGALNGGTGDDTISGDQVAVISGGDGNDLILTGTQTQVSGGTGDDIIRLHPMGLIRTAAVDGGTGTDSVILDPSAFSGGGDTLTANGAEADLHYVKAGATDSLWQLTGIENITMTGSSAADSFFVGNLSGSGVQSVTVDVGAGDANRDTVRVLGTAGADRVVVSDNFASPHLQVTGLSATVSILDFNPANDVVTLDTGAGDDLVDLTNVFDARGFRFEGGAGNDTVTTGFAPDTIVFDRTGNHDVVNHFRGVVQFQHDVIDVTALRNDFSFGDMVAHHHIFQSGSNVIISDGLGSTLTLTGNSLSGFGNADFLFASPIT